MHQKIILIFLVLLFLSSSCNTVQYIKTGTEYSSLPETEEVAVYLSKIPEEDFVEIGIILVNMNDLDAAKKQARLVGGNALIKLQGVDLKFAIVKIVKK